MRLLVNENIHADLVTYLRDRQCDVTYVAEHFASLDDKSLLQLAETQERVIVTDDKDFGDLVYHQRLNSYDIILLRLNADRIADRISRLEAIRPEVQKRQPGSLIVISDHKMRIRPISGPK